MLTALLVVFALANPAADNLPRFRTSTAIVEVTPELVWYDIRFHDVEAASCEVGVSDDGEIVVSRCRFPPGSYGESTPARKVGPIVRQFRKQQRRARNIRVGYLRRGRQVRVEDVVPIEGRVASDYAIFEHGEWLFALVGDELTPLRNMGGGTGLYCFRDDCDGRYWLPDVTPEPLEGTSVLGNAFADDAPSAYQDAAAAMFPVIVDAVAAIDRGESGSWPTDERGVGFPQHRAFGLSWSPGVYAHPAPSVAESGARPPEGFAPVFTMTLDEVRSGVFDQTQTESALGLTVRARLDLERQWARVDFTRLGQTVWQDFRVVPEWVDEQGNPWLKQIAEWEETDRSPTLMDPSFSPRRVGIDGTGDVLHYLLVANPPERSRRVVPVIPTDRSPTLPQ